MLAWLQPVTMHTASHTSLRSPCQDEDLEALRQQLAQSQQTAEALRGSGVEARAQAQEYGERARRAETLNQEHSADLASLRQALPEVLSAHIPTTCKGRRMNITRLSSSFCLSSS